MALAVNRRIKVHWKINETKHGFLRSDSENREVLRLEQQSVQVGKCAVDSTSSSVTMTLVAVPGFVWGGREGVNINAIRFY